MLRGRHSLSFLFAALVALIIAGMLPTNLALAAGISLEVTLRTDFPVVNSGSWAVVNVDYRCASITSTPCEDVVISSVLPPELARAAGDVQVIGAGATTSYDPASATARWAFNSPLSPGDSGTFELRVRFPAGSTPDGTVALLRAEIGASNAPPVRSNLLPLTARATARARADKRFVSGGVLDLPTVYELEVCVPNAGSGALDLSNVVISDRLPSGATFVSASDGGTFNSATNTVSWPAASILVSAGQSCALRTVTVVFSDVTFDVGNEVRNDMSAQATALGGATLSLSDSDIRLIQPPTPGTEFAKNGPATAEVGDTVRYSFTERNTGTTALDNHSVVDTIPAELRVSRIFAAGHNLPATLRLQIAYQTSTNPSWTAASVTPFTGADCINIDPTSGGGCGSSISLAPTEYITALRWTYLDSLPYGWQTTGGGNGFEATVVSVPANQIIVNNADARFSYNGYTILENDSTRSRVVVEPPAARPSLEKTVSTAIAYSGDTVTYHLTLRNNTFRTLSTDLVGPQIVDLLENKLIYVAGSAQVIVAPSGAPAPSFALIPNYQGSGRELLSWSWSGYHLAPGEAIEVAFDARIAPFTAAGNIDNTAYLAGWDNPSTDILLDSCSGQSRDTRDFDNDGNTQEQICSSTISSISLSEAASTGSLKLVKGQLDTAWTKDPAHGFTVYSGSADYQLTITNTGTIPVSELVLVDILPWVGDKGVLRFDQDRESEWRPFLIAPIAAPSGATVYYSTANNPCRVPDLGLSSESPGCVDPAWSTQPPADITTVQSFKIDFGSLVLNAEDSVTIGVRMHAPYGGTAGEIAWNSFAYRAREVGSGDYLLASEPPRVGIEREAPQPPAYGNYIWVDQNTNGIQDTGEPGINGVRIELYRDSDGSGDPSAGDTFVSDTISGPDDDGNPGFYLFSESFAQNDPRYPAFLPPGDYYTRFTPPAGYAITLQNAGSDTGLDSDVDPDTRYTPVTSLAAGEMDLSWDLGVTTTAAAGNYVWLDLNQNGLQDEPAGYGLNGVTVNLRRGGDNSLVNTTVTADDHLGRPGYYIFSPLTPGSYYVEFVLPTGFSFTTQNSGADTIDSDADPATGRGATFSIAAGQLDLSHDAGLTLPGGSLRLGNLVWRDLDNNGRYDPAIGEYGIDGVRLDLYRDANGNSQPDAGENAGSTTTTTRLGQAGWYQFDNLAAGSYLVVVDASNFAPAGALVGLRTSSGNDPAPDPDDNRDSDDNGSLSGAVVAGRAITLSLNGEPSAASDGDDANGNQTYDFGFIAKAALGNFVWYDANGNGRQDSGEPPVPGVTVELLDAAGTTVLASTVTNDAGLYGFSELDAGSYRVRFANLPAGYSFSSADQGSDDGDSDADPASGETGPISLSLNQVDLTWDAGLVAPRASIGNFVWHDQNYDGIQDAGEPGLNGVGVRLFSPGANGAIGGGDDLMIANTSTGPDGSYGFSNLIPGNYYVEFDLPAGYTPSPQNSGGNDTIDSDADIVTRRTAITSLSPNENDPSWDMGVFSFASIGDRVWFDRNRDGIQDADQAVEPGVSGVTVRLYRPGNSTPVATTTTNASGVYSFTNLPEADYYLEFAMPAGYRTSLRDAGGDDTRDSDPDLKTFQTIVTHLDPGENDPSWDFGIYPTAAIGNFAWLDRNANGIQDAGEAGVPGVQVVLYDNLGNDIDSTATDASGFYSFADLVPGTYSLRFVLPPSFVLSPQGQGSNPALDSDADPATLETIATLLEPGENDTSWDIGIYQLSSVGDRVWHDINANGVQDSGEPGLNNVEVRLYTSGNTLVDTQTTDVNGNYLFASLSPKDYYVEFDMPASYTNVSQPDSADADDNTDSDANTTTRRTPIFSLDSSTSDLRWDMGVYNLAGLGDRVWLDSDIDGVQDGGESGVNGVTVRLFHSDGSPAGAPTTTADLAGVAGYYSFTNLTPGSYYVVFSNLPADHSFTRQNLGSDSADSDVNPASGQTAIINLGSGQNDLTWDAGIYPTIRVGDRVWIDTNADGVQDAGETLGVPGVRVELRRVADNSLVDYTYTDGSGNYLFGDLFPDSYRVVFTNIPAGYLRSPQDQGGDDSQDSDADSAFTTADFSVSSGSDLTRDLGLYQPASIGNYVWHDLNANGIQETGEPAIENAEVRLRTPGPDGIAYNGDDVTIGSDTTDASGIYGFSDLTPGRYYIELVMPAGYDRVSPADQGGDDTLDSDIDPATLHSAVTDLISGENDPSWDAGLYQLASLGDFVWEDLNGNGVQDAGEPGVDAVPVKLYTPGPNGVVGGGDDVLAGSTSTNATGFYSFTNLNPGQYYVVFTAPGGYAITYADISAAEVAGANDGNDSDADRSSGATALTTLVSNEDDMSWDAGLYKPASLGNYVWEDTNGDGVQDGSESGFNTVGVRLIGAGRDRSFGTADDSSATASTNASGLYLFNNLIPGLYQVEFTRPTGYAFTRGDNTVATDSGDSDVAEGIPATARTATTDLSSSETDLTWDAGLYRVLSLGNLVWNDLNDNGSYDSASESGINGVSVQLYIDTNNNSVKDAGDILVATTSTSGGGLYRFDNLLQGNYLVAIPATNFTSSGTLRYFRSSDKSLAPDTAADPDDNQNNDDNGVWPNSSVTTSGVASKTISLSPNAEPPADTNDDGDADSYSNLSVDFGFYSVTVGNLVWGDADNDGIKDASESGLTRTVRLYYDADGSGALNGGETTPAATFLTTVDGRYMFGGLRSGGRYQVSVSTGGATWISSTGGANGTNSGPYEPGKDVDGDPSDGDDNGTQAAGNIATSPFFIVQAGGENTGDDDSLPAGVTLNPFTDNNSDFSVDFGLFNYAQVGDRAWIDANGNGVQDGGESGQSGVTVRLYDSTNALVATTTTNAGGTYGFSYLLPGSYSITFSNIPTGYAISPRDVGSNTSDSDADPASGGTVSFPLSAGANDTSWDMGIYPLLSLGNLVWDDQNDNGTFDAGESGIDGVSLELYRDTNSNSAYDAGIDALVDSTGTAGGGLYLFSDLEQGRYFVLIPASEFVSGGKLYRYRSSTGVNGPASGGYEPAPDPDNDINDDDNGSGPVVGPVISAAIDLSPGAEPTNDGDAGNNSNLSLDFGFFPPLSLGNLVWEDTNNDGLKDGSESGIANVRIELYLDGNGNSQADGNELVDFTTTDGSGNYSFIDLIPGDYIVLIPAGQLGAGQALEGYISSTGTNGSASGAYEAAPDADSNIDDDDNGSAGPDGVISLPVSLARGDEPSDDGDGSYGNQSIDFGLFRPAGLGDLVWHDANANGVQDGGESGIDGVGVRLYDGANTLVATTSTDASGIYGFGNLRPDSYVVEFDLPATFDRVSPQDAATATDDTDSDADPTTRRTVSTTLVAGQNDPSWDMGAYRLAAIGDLVWLDNDGNGRQDAGENGLDGVTVELYDGAGTTLLQSTSTSGGGAYSFSGLIPGDYSLRFVAPAGYQLTLAGSPEATATTDSDADPASGRSAATTLGSEENDPSWDAGLYESAELGDYVWEDTNADGDQDSGEPGIDGVNVTLDYAGPDATFGTADDVTSFATTSTAGGGRYQFSDLRPGTYRVVFERPSGYAFSAQDQAGGDDAADSDVPAGNAASGTTVATDLESRESDQSWDAGLYRPRSLGDRVWEDRDGDGIQGADEPGVPDVTVSLYDGSNDTLLGTQTTDADGNYRFDDLLTGSYYLVFSDLPAGYRFSAQSQGSDDTADSDPDPTSGRTETLTLGSVAYDQSWDAGILTDAALGDRVWNDRDGDGIQDVDEAGVNDVTVTLYQPGPDELPGSADDILIDTTTTATVGGVDGIYSFTNLAPGRYFVTFSDLPAGWIFTLRGRGSDPSSDSDANPTGGQSAIFLLASNGDDRTWDAGIYLPARIGDLVWSDTNLDGIQDSGEAGVPNVIVRLYRNGVLRGSTSTDANGNYSFNRLPEGDYIVRVMPPIHYRISPQGAGSDPAADSDIDRSSGRTAAISLSAGDDVATLDAGIYQLASVGNRIWEDSDGDGIYDEGEQGVQGVTVELHREDGTLVTTAVSDADGAFIFEDVEPGSYYIDFHIPEDYIVSPQKQGSDPGIDSDADPSTGRTAVFTLTAGQQDLTWWLGMARPPSAISLLSFTAERQSDGMLLRWETGTELNTAGFQIYRSAGSRADAVRVSDQLIPAHGASGGGAVYSWLDSGAESGVAYSYWLVEIEIGGARHEYPLDGPAKPGPSQTYMVNLPLLRQ